MANVLIVGATSGIAQHVARSYAEEGSNLYLLARNPERLETLARDLKVRGAARIATEGAELTDCDLHEGILSRAWKAFGSFDVVLVAYGSLPDQGLCERDFSKTAEATQVNFLSVVSWLTLLANRLEKEGRGTIAVISSVAGDRGRKSNYVYGASKGALSIFLQGLRNRLYRSGVHVLTIKPGFVDTPMTAHLKKNFLFASPEKVGRKIHRAIQKRKNVLYTPSFWRWVMAVIRHLPEAIFKRLNW